VQRTTYDGFDRIAQQTKQNASGTGTTTSRYTYDPLDRTASQTDNVGATGEKSTTFNYLGLSGDVIDEQIAGQLQRSYQYSPWGERLSQAKRNTDGTSEDSFYGYDPHTSVETLTDTSGDTKATYGYTAYGQNDDGQFTGVDKPDPADPTKQPYNFYRYTAKRFDPASGTYDLGFRDYDPGLNRFLTRDLYNGALADLDLSTDPFTNNRYTFASGNPTTMVDLDGHTPTADNMVSANPQLNVWLNTSYAKAQAEGKGGTIRPPTTLMVAVPIKDDDRNILQRLWNGLFDVATGYEATDHARYIAEVAKRAGVDPRTLMAIIMQESGTRQRWPLVGQEEFHLTIINALGLKKTSIGIGGMQQGVFARTAAAHPEVLGRQVTADEAKQLWPRLMTDGGLAIRAAAYHLADLQRQLVGRENKSSLSLQQLMASAYNGGIDSAQRALSTGQVINPGYVRNFDGFFSQADQFYCQSGRYECRTETI
jgi:RHS repeat-associated protein